MAQTLAEKQGLKIDFRVAAAEAQPFADKAFQAITASQCWLYFDKQRMHPEVKRLLEPGGVLVTSHFSRHYRLRGMFYYDEAIPFTREGWCGRIRACRGIGAALSPEEVAQFDKEHFAMLAREAGENFKILHRIDAHLFEPI